MVQRISSRTRRGEKTRGLRPTAARTLESVFNMLQGEIAEESGQKKEELDLDERTIEALKAFGYLQ